MPLKFNGKELSKDSYIEKVRNEMPKGKDKRVTFVLCNARPFQVRDDKGNQSQRIAGETSVHTFDTVTLELRGENGKFNEEGVLQYYETSTRRPSAHGMVESMEPSFVNFAGHKLSFDAEKNSSLFYFLLANSANEENSGKYGKVPVFKLVKPADSAKKSVSSIDLEFDAIAKVKELRKSNKKQLRALYEASGFNDFEEKLDSEDWDSILAPMYALCKTNPVKALEMMNDAGLDISAKVVNALAAGIIKQDGDAVYWGDHIKVELKKRKITNIPKGKGSAWQEWFTNNYLRTEVEIVEELNTELILAGLTKR